MKKLALENHIAIANFSVCENLLKKSNDIPDSTSLFVRNLQFDSCLNIKNWNDTTASDSVSFNFFDPQKFEKLNMSLCSDLSASISIPIKYDKIDMKSYRKSASLKNKVDIYNKFSVGFQSRCFSVQDIDSAADTTINFRRTFMYKNQTILCSGNCTYDGIDDNNYIICNCPIEENFEISNNFTNWDILTRFPDLNFDIITCFYETLGDVSILLIHI